MTYLILNESTFIYCNNNKKLKNVLKVVGFNYIFALPLALSKYFLNYNFI